MPLCVAGSGGSAGGLAMKNGILSKRNIILIGGVLSMIGLIGPWLNFSEYDKGTVHHFDMNPLYLSVRTTSSDPTIPPGRSMYYFYRIDASFLGLSDLLGGILVLGGTWKSSTKLCWLGLSLIFISLLLFPTVLPIIFLDTTPRWGMISTAAGMVLILITMCIEFISKRYEMGFPRR